MKPPEQRKDSKFAIFEESNAWNDSFWTIEQPKQWGIMSNNIKGYGILTSRHLREWGFGLPYWLERIFPDLSALPALPKKVWNPREIVGSSSYFKGSGSHFQHDSLDHHSTLEFEKMGIGLGSLLNSKRRSFFWNCENEKRQESINQSQECIDQR